MQTPPLPPVPQNSFFANSWRAFTQSLRKDNYSRLQGRAGRFEFWSVTLWGSIVCVVPLPFLLIPCLPVQLLMLLLFLFLVVYLAMPMLAVYVRRIHDTGWSGWWLAAFYALVSFFFGWAVFLLTGLMFHEEMALDLAIFVVLDIFLEADMLIMPFFCIMDALSILLFILTVIPGNPLANKYGEPV